jgi:hypothetical protein
MSKTAKKISVIIKTKEMSSMGGTIFKTFIVQSAVDIQKYDGPPIKKETYESSYFGLKRDTIKRSSFSIRSNDVEAMDDMFTLTGSTDSYSFWQLEGPSMDSEISVSFDNLLYWADFTFSKTKV